MNNEIKEILDRLDYNEWEVYLYKVPITWCELYDIRDYITNLQQEINKLTAESTEWESKCYDLQQENERLEGDNDFLEDTCNDLSACIKEQQRDIDDYKTRCDKAIEYIENPRHEMSVLTYQNLLNILQNGSEKDE